MTWTVFLTARTEAKAQKILGWLTDQLGREIDQYELEPQVLVGVSEKRHFYLLKFNLRLEATVWNDAVVESIALGQRVGKMWELSGDVLKDLVLRTSFARLSGVASLEYRLNDKDPRTEVQG